MRVATTVVSCVGCGEATGGRWYVNHWNLPFHGFQATCDACGHPTAEVRPDPLCRTCRTTVVVDPADATIRARGVRRLLLRRSIEIDANQVRYGLARVPLPGRDALGVARTWVARLPHEGAFRSEVAIKRGLPAPYFESVVAHELTHVWLRINDARPASIVEEGVAELTAHWLRGRVASPHAIAIQLRIATNRDRTYGGGFRNALKAERRHGWPTVAETVLATGRLPR